MMSMMMHMPRSGPIDYASMSNKVPDFPTDAHLTENKEEREFGSLTSKEWLCVSKHTPGRPLPKPVVDEPPYYILIATYLSFLILIIIGHIKDFFGRIFMPKQFEPLMEKNGYAPWYSRLESFYTRRMKVRLDDCFARKTHGAPGRYVTCYNRFSPDYNHSFYYDGTTTDCLNLSSYNYLGFGQSSGICTDNAVEALEQRGVSACGPRLVIGTSDLHLKCEKVVAEFVGKEDAMVFAMGYGTNAFLFSSLVNSKCLVISDSLNHASTRFGVRLSGAAVKIFPHNDIKKLEKILKDAIAQGQPKTHRPWKKILVAVEGLFSMEGDLCNLPELVELRDKYKFYLFVDEAHSIGALGPHGKGVCDYFDVDPSRVDLLMGTFTKSFGATGGYVAANKDIIQYLRKDILTNAYGETPAPAVLEQIITSLGIINGDLNGNEGQERLQRIAFNSRYLRLGLKRLGFIVYGADDSPVIPLLLYLPAKMPAISRMMYERNIAIVVTCYPATDLLTARVRFCLSSSLMKEDIDYILKACDDISKILQIKYSSGMAGGERNPGDYKKGIKPRWSIEEVLEKTPYDCKGEMI
ncbi:unnamed protein product [Kuraishia capsulata CBS 1993]|uniref:Aminotransferase class I/classII large domain-containing protein n=1 Tax=Kuraishia capsulata CBS 1993 TaxID=1382522 RepID=W6MR47_9ASCO|nr:uncharacterized protein KUCA_T00005173001 [Kuraishia capsulata CBS 1993]CDK29186.1 unnamed protein product [Kuraishia capsulata CBS 1993]